MRQQSDTTRTGRLLMRRWQDTGHEPFASPNRGPGNDTGGGGGLPGRCFINSPHTLPGLIAALDQVTTMPTHAARDATSDSRAAPATGHGYPRPAIDALTQAATAQTGFAGRPAHAPATAAAQLGSSDAPTSRRPRPREASLPGQLIKATTGHHDKLLPNHTGHSPSAQTTN